jgi:hypothetical protein
MGIMDTLNNLTNQLNNAADKVLNSNNTYNGAAQGTEGLGIINTDNANGQLASPGGFINKVDKDSRKLATYMEQFIDSDKYVQYISNWFSSIGIGTELAGSVVNINIPTQQGVYTPYSVFACRNQAEADNALAYLSQNNNGQQNVLIGYIAYSTREIQTANTCNTQLIGISEINEINNAIDLADKHLPYIATSKAKFVSIISKYVHDLYTGKNGGVSAQVAFNSATSGVESSLNGFSNRVQEAANGFAAGMGLSQATQNQDYTQQPQPTEQQTEFSEQQEQNHVVSLSKEENQIDDVENTDESVKVSLSKN